MRIDSLHLQNFANHESLDLEFKPGVNIIVGQNGAGKSNVIRAISYALTGDLHGTNRAAMNIRTVNGEPLPYANVQLAFESSGIQGVVSRTIQGTGSSRATLTYGPEEHRSVSTVNTRLSELCGVDSKTASKFVFIQQGHLADLFKATNADRKDLFNLLFGTSNFNTYINHLKGELDRYRVITKPAKTQQEYREALNSMLYELEQLDNSIGEVNSKLMSKQDLESLRRELYSYRDYQSKLSKLPQLENNLESSQAKLTKLTKEQVDLSKEKSEVDDSIAELVEYRNALISKIKAKRAVYDRQRAMADLKLELDSKLLRLEKLTEPEEVPDPGRNGSGSPAEALREELDALGIPELKRALRGFTGDTPTCPTCSTSEIVNPDGSRVPVSEFVRTTQDKLNNAERAAEEIHRKLNKLQEEYFTYVSEYKHYCNVKSDLNSEVNSLNAKYELLEEQLHGEEVVSDTYIDSLDRELSEVEDSLQTGKELQVATGSRLRDLNTSVTDLSNTVYSLKNSIAEIKKAKVVDLDPDKAEKTIEIQDDLILTKADLQARYEEMVRQYESLEDQRLKDEKLEEKAKSRLKYGEVVQASCALLHRDALPAYLAAAYVAPLNQEWNKILSMFDVPFTAELISAPGTDMDLTLQFRFPDGIRESCQLSGGQTCAAALSFLIAVNRQFASQAGILVLDEPTYGLSKEKLDLLPEIMYEVQEYAQSVGMQIFLVTHEDRLFLDFDNIITL